MFKSIAGFVGFDWIKNPTIKKIFRIAAAAGAAAASMTPGGAAILAMVGITTPAEAVTAITAVMGAIEAVRGLVKHS